MGEDVVEGRGIQRSNLEIKICEPEVQDFTLAVGFPSQVRQDLTD